MKKLQLLIKPVSANCDMQCRYCFYQDVAGLRRKNIPGGMSAKTLETVVKKALEAADESCVFGFQGGEPTLAGLDFYRRCVALVKAYKKEETNVFYTIQTNGLHLTGDWIDFLVTNKFLTGISLDGTLSIHDSNRKDCRGEGTFRRVLANGKALKEAGGAVNILCVLTKRSSRDAGKIYAFLKKEGFCSHQYIPCMDPLGEARGRRMWSLSPGDYGDALCALFDLWYGDYVQYLNGGTPGVFIRQFDSWLWMLLGEEPEACAQYGTCTVQNVVEADGSIYPCDFYALDEYCMGNIAETDFETLRKAACGPVVCETDFFADAAVRDARCPSCRWYPLCRGGCRRDCLKADTEAGTPQQNYYCESYRKFFTYAIERLEYLACRVDRKRPRR